MPQSAKPREIRYLAKPLRRQVTIVFNLFDLLKALGELIDEIRRSLVPQAACRPRVTLSPRATLLS